MSRALRVLPALLLFAVLVGFPAVAEESCFDCHSDADNVGDAKLVVQDAAWQATVHGAAGTSCADCHDGKAGYPHAADEPAAPCAPLMLSVGQPSCKIKG